MSMSKAREAASDILKIIGPENASSSKENAFWWNLAVILTQVTKELDSISSDLSTVKREVVVLKGEVQRLKKQG